MYRTLCNFIIDELLLQISIIEYFMVKGMRMIIAQNSLRVDDLRVTAERQIPLEVADDSFYSKKNMDELERRVANIRTGKSVLKEHDLIEVE